MAENTDLQEPEKSEQKKKKPGEKQGMSLPVVIMLILAVVIVQAVLFILIYKFVLVPNAEEEGVDPKSKTEEVDPNDPMGEMKDMTDIDSQEQEFLAGEEDRDFFETERITTNPKNSTKYVVLKLSFEYRAHPTLIENLPDEDKANDKLKKDGPYMTKIIAKTKSIVIDEIGNLTETEIQSDRPKLMENIESKLKELFWKKKIFLREVNTTEFIVQ